MPWLAMSWIASIVLTEVRLVLLATNEATYHWWHDGLGATLYGLLALTLAVVFPAMAVRIGRAAETPPSVRQIA